MVRGGALTLGAILMLGALNGAKAQDAGSFPSLAGVFPALPQNWSDLPVQLKVSEIVGYNSNVLNTPSNSGIFRPISTFESTSTYGVSTKWNWAGDQFFADGNYGFYRYLNDATLNKAHNSADAGVNWVYTSRCTGKLIASESTTPSTPGQQVGVNVLNTVTSTAFNETANCGVSGNWGFIFNSGTTASNNSAAADSLNNFQNVFVAAGLTYSVAQTNTLQLLATVTGTHYGNRGSLANQVGLLTKFTEDQIHLSYTRVIDPNLSLIASIGVVGLANGDFDLGAPSGFEGQYSFSVTWSITPKLNLTGSIARVASPPTSFIGNLQISESASVNLAYQLTPKVTLGAGVGVNRSSGFSGALGSSQNNYNVRANLGYAMSPFLNANLSYQYNREVQLGGLVTPTGVALLTVNYAPY